MSDEFDKETMAWSHDGWRERALRLERELAEARLAIERWSKDANRLAERCAKDEIELDAARAERDAFDRQASGLLAEANILRAEVEAAFRAGRKSVIWTEEDRHDGQRYVLNEDAAWSRYQVNLKGDQ